MKLEIFFGPNHEGNTKLLRSCSDVYLHFQVDMCYNNRNICLNEANPEAVFRSHSYLDHVGPNICSTV
jgi:hypothetical protein